MMHRANPVPTDHRAHQAPAFWPGGPAASVSGPYAQAAEEVARTALGLSDVDAAALQNIYEDSCTDPGYQQAAARVYAAAQAAGRRGGVLDVLDGASSVSGAAVDAAVVVLVLDLVDPADVRLLLRPWHARTLRLPVEAVGRVQLLADAAALAGAGAAGAGR